jgi:glucosamine--fructose-6-phosphate aminotransferase (isomerizing)
MCGIVGYVGPHHAVDLLVEGLRRLEYRGYDSSGIATVGPDRPLLVTKAAGRIDELVAALARSPLNGTTGIGHTRWATHGAATDANAHPHLGGDGAVAIVHNGVIENYRALKGRLKAEGYSFHSGTDSEVLAHLIDQQLKVIAGDPLAATAADPYRPLVAAVEGALSQIRGTYGLVVLFRDWPDVMIAARMGSPLVIGIGQGEHFVASDGSPLVGHTDKIVYLADRELAVVTAEGLRVLHAEQGPVEHDVRTLQYETDAIDLKEYSHYMLKEIFEQPETLRNAMRVYEHGRPRWVHFARWNHF